MTNETKGGVTIKGNPLTTLGDRISVGDRAPAAQLRNGAMKTVSLDDWGGKIRLVSVVPSLDTGICDAQTRRLNEEAANLGDDVVVLTVSAEHPFNQKRWCGAAGIDRVEVLSDHYDMNFGSSFGTHIKEWRLNQRAMFVIDGDGVVRYAEYVPEIAQHPDYESALQAVSEVVNE